MQLWPLSCRLLQGFFSMLAEQTAFGAQPAASWKNDQAANGLRPHMQACMPC